MPVFRSDWKHATLQSTDATEIRIDFQSEATTPTNPLDSTTYAASPAWLNVSRPDLSPGRSLRAVLLDKANAPFSSDVQGLDVYAVDLTPAEQGRFTAPIPRLKIGESGPHRAVRHYWEIALVEDGEWKRDPVSRTSNFLIDPTKV